MNHMLYYHFCRTIELAGAIAASKDTVRMLAADLQLAVAEANIIAIKSIACQIEQRASEASKLRDKYQQHRNALYEDDTNAFALERLDRMAKLTP